MHHTNSSLSSEQFFKNRTIRLAILEQMAHITAVERDYFYSCERFPGYLWGNGALISTSHYTSLAAIIDQLKAHYPSLSNYLIAYLRQENQEKIMQEAQEAGHEIATTRVMQASVDQLQLPTIPQALSKQISTVVSEEDWQLYRQHERLCREEAWYVQEGYDKKRLMTEKLDLDWFACFDSSGERIVSSAGLLQVGSLAQLKNVQTTPGEQRKGYATAVLGAIGAHLLQQSSIREVYLTTDSHNDQSMRIYTKLGFTLLPQTFLEIIVREKK